MRFDEREARPERRRTMQAFALMREELKREREIKAELLEALKKLKAEVAGLVGIAELRPIIGNTNFNVLIQRWDEARAIIEKAEGRQP